MVTRRLAHEPLGWRPTTLLIRVRRYRCTGCGHVWRQDTSKAAEPRAELSRRGLRWALEGIVCQHLTVARIAEGLRVSWNTATRNKLALPSLLVDLEPAFRDGSQVTDKRFYQGLLRVPLRCRSAARGIHGRFLRIHVLLRFRWGQRGDSASYLVYELRALVA